MISPDLVLTHYRDDLHQDHRLISELTWNTFRDQLILEYEIPKYDGDLGAPNVFVPLDDPLCRRKIEMILTGFPSQAGKRWFSEDSSGPSCACAEWSATRPAAMPKPSTVDKLIID